MPAPSAAASAIAALLSAIAAARAAGSAWVKNPPRHRLETCSPAGADGRGRGGQPGLGDVLAPQPDRRDVVPGAQVDGLGAGSSWLTVAWFSESRPATARRVPVTPRS